MAYSIYTPMQGPTVPTSIFSSAAERGSKSGMQIDNAETARLKGQLLGREKVLQEQQAQANIEATQANTAAKIEATKGQKLQNKLAPIKEGLGMLGQVAGLVTGVQGIMQNANNLELQENKLKLDNIKTQTELEVSSLTLDTAIVTAQNNYTEVKRNADDLRVQQDISEAMASNDPNALKTTIATPEAQNFFMRNPEVAVSAHTTLANQGGMTQEQLDGVLSTYYSKMYAQNDLKVKSLQSSAKQKALTQYAENAQAYQDSDVYDIIARNAPGKEDDFNYISNLDVVPRSMYEEKEVDGARFVDLASKPSDSASAVGHYLIEKDTGKIISGVDSNGEKYGKIINSLVRSNTAHANKQKEILNNGKLQRTPQGDIVKKVDQPASGKLPVMDLGAIKESLRSKNVPQEAIDRASASGVTAGKEYREGGIFAKAKEVLKSTVNKIAPSFIDTISEESFQDADKASAALAKETVAAYKKASPSQKKIMEENLKTKIPWTAKMLSSLEEAADKMSPGWRERSQNASGSSRSVMQQYLEGEGGEQELAKIYREEMISDLEKVRDAGMTQGEADRSATNEERKITAERELKAAARTATNPVEAAKIYDQYKQLTGKDLNSAVPTGEINAAKVSQTVGALKQTLGFSDTKAANIENTVNIVQSNKYLSDKPAYVRAIAAQEPAGKMGQVSPTGVKGLMQVSSAVEKDFGYTGLDRTVPEDNVALGQMYIDKMYSEFGDKSLAYAAYNSGAKTVNDAIRLSGGKRTWEEIKPFMLEACKLNFSNSPTPMDKFLEVRDYPTKVGQYELIFNQLS